MKATSSETFGRNKGRTVQEQHKLTDVERWAVAKNSPKELGEWLEEYRVEITARCIQLLRNPAEAEEVAQECFMYVIKKARTEPQVKNMRAWLYRTAFRKSVDRLRKRKHHTTYEEAIRHEGTLNMSGSVYPNHPIDHMQDGALGDELQACMDVLDQEEQEVVVCKALRGLSFREIGEFLGQPLGTVASRFSRARSKMRKELQRTGKSEVPQ